MSLDAVCKVEADWAVLDLPYMRDIIKQAAKRVHMGYPHCTEIEDLEQEATLLLVEAGPRGRAPMAARARECWEAHDDESTPLDLGTFQHELELNLTDLVRPIASRQSRTISYDKLVEDAEADGFVLPYVVIETASNDYTRESVETLLPAVWDESYVYGLPQRDDAPDPDMPKGSTNKARGNNLSAYIADIKTGWDKTPLTQKERIALLLAYGLGWTHEQIAYNQNVSRQTISERIDTAIGKIVARLNGGYWYELEGIEP